MEQRQPTCWEEAEARGISIHFVDLHGISGLNAEGNIIFLQKGMTERDTISILWHELGHHARGETHVASAVRCKSEIAADLYAAERLIDPDELARLAVLYPDDTGRLAYELGVADWVLESYLGAHPEVSQMGDDAA